MSAAEHHSPHDLQAVRQWLAPLVRVNLWFHYQGGNWYCLVEDFDITGMGATRDDAFADMLGLLGAYLGSHYKAGVAFEHTRRPIPSRLKLQIRARAAGSTMLARFGRTQGAVPRSEELATFIPADALRPAFC